MTKIKVSAIKIKTIGISLPQIGISLLHNSKKYCTFAVSNKNNKSMILIQNNKLQKALDKVGLGAVKLYRDNGYFFITSDNAEMADKICQMHTTMIYFNTFGQQPIQGWVEDIQALFNETNF